jgi:acetyl-CoA acetyltransferase
MKEFFSKVGFNPAILDDISIGNCCQAQHAVFFSRLAALYSDVPYTTPVRVDARLGASGIESVVWMTNAIALG